MNVLHLISAAEWHALGEHESFGEASVAVDGFVHCSGNADTMLRVANAFYAARPGDFVVLTIDADRLTSPCRWEPPSAPADPDGSTRDHPEGVTAAGTLLPHVYGPIECRAVVAVQTLRRDASGAFVAYGEPEWR